MPDLIQKPKLPPPVNELQKANAAADLKETNPNIYYVRGKRVVLEDPSMSFQEAFEATRKAKFADLKPEEMFPANPALHKESVSPGMDNFGAEFWRGVLRPAAFAAGSMAAAPFTGGSSLIPVVAGIGASLATDLMAQQAQGEHRKTSFTEDFGLVEKGSVAGKVAGAAEGMAEDYLGGRVVSGIGKAIGLARPAIKSLQDPVIQKILDATGSVGQKLGSTTLMGLENHAARKAKLALQGVQAKEIEAAAMRTFTSRGAGRFQDQLATDIVQKATSMYTKSIELTKTLGDEMVNLASAGEASGMPAHMLKAFGGPPKEELVQMVATKDWAANFLKYDAHKPAYKDLVEPARNLLTGEARPFREAYGMYLSDVSKRQGEIFGGGDLDPVFDSLRAAVKEDISASVPTWTSAKQASVLWRKLTEVHETITPKFHSLTGLQTLIENSTSPIPAIESILANPQKLASTLSSEVLKVPGFGMLSSNLKEDLKTYVIQKALVEAKDPVTGMLNAKNLASFAEDFPAKRELFTAPERANIDQFFKDASYLQSQPASLTSGNGRLARIGAEGVFLAGSVLLGSSTGGVMIAGSILTFELGRVGLARTLAKNGRFGRLIMRAAKGEPLGMPASTWAREVSGMLNGIQGAFHLEDGTKVPGEWKGGTFYPEGTEPPTKGKGRDEVNRPPAFRPF